MKTPRITTPCYQCRLPLCNLIGLSMPLQAKWLTINNNCYRHDQNREDPVTLKTIVPCRNNTICYSVPETGRVKLDVIDGRGMHAIRLTSGAKKITAIKVGL